MEHYGKASFLFHLPEFYNGIFCFFFRKRPHFICSLLCYLSMQENIQTNIKGKNLRSSRTQMFFKIAVLKNFAVLPRKHLCWSLFLIKLQAQVCVFIKKETLTQVFSCEYCKIFKKSFFIKHLLFIILFRNFM